MKDFILEFSMAGLGYKCEFEKVRSRHSRKLIRALFQQTVSVRIGRFSDRLHFGLCGLWWIAEKAICSGRRDVRLTPKSGHTNSALCGCSKVAS
jgi:hypothetical protein